MLGRRNRLVLSRRWDDMRVVASRVGLLAVCLLTLVACFVPVVRWSRFDVVVRGVAVALALTGGVALVRWRRPDLSELAVGQSRAISPSGAGGVRPTVTRSSRRTALVRTGNSRAVTAGG